jgi:hypothetical protein
VTEVLTSVGALATAAGVIAAFLQLRANGKQARLAFEETLTARYHGLVSALPVWAFFDAELTKDQKDHISGGAILSEFYRYFDLCNEQVYLYQHGRIDEVTWEEWRQGIAGNLCRPSFVWAWEELIRPNVSADFDELRALYSEIRGAAAAPGQYSTAA